MTTRTRRANGTGDVHRKPPSPPPNTARRLTRALALLVAVATMVEGCKGNAQVLYPRKIGAGRPPGCPDTGAVPLGVDSEVVISSDNARCTYTDALGGSVIRVAGKVLAESGKPGTPDAGMPDVQVSIYKLKGPVNPDNPGDPILRVTTTRQGNYSLSTPLANGRYILLVHDQDGQFLTYSTLDITDQDSGALLNTNIVVPLNPELRPPPSAPSTTAPE